MPIRPPTVCLITPGHLSSTPRLLKEADSLAAAGCRVHVVAGRNFAPADALDAEALRGARWTCTRIDARGGAGAVGRKLLRHAARRLLPLIPRRVPLRLAALAQSTESLRLAAAAAAVPADLYRGHCLAALWATVRAARVRGAKASFDLEDFHDEETIEAAADPVETAAIRTLQAGLLPRCGLTVAAPLIGAEYARRYGADATVLLNAFPLAQAPAAPVQPGPVTATRPARFYWFSQTVGPGRGLEGVIDILARMRTPAELHVRGFASENYRASLQRRAAESGVRPVVFLPAGPAAEMVRLAADADLGLSTETPPPLNRDLCLTNKVFVYLLAVLPPLLTPPAGQRALAAELGDAGFLATPADPAATAAALDAHFADPAAVARARAAAWRLGQTRFNWDAEQRVFLRHVAGLLPGIPL